MLLKVTRRSFLHAVGAAGGAGVLYGTMGALGLAPTAATAAAPPFRAPRKSDFTLSGRASKRILVLGAGIAGLTTAYELGKAGYECQILEALDRPGGRNWTVRGGTTATDLDGNEQQATFSPGQYMNAGPARIAQWMVTLDYCRELGVDIEVFTNTNANAYIYNENVGPLSSTPIRYRAAKADVYGYVAEILAKATDQAALDSQLTATDKERLLAFLEHWGAIGGRVPGDPAASWRYTGTDRRGYTVLPGAGLEQGTVDGPAPELSAIFASQIGRYFSFEFSFKEAMVMFQPVGGMDRIPHALAKAVGSERITYRAEVRGITNRSDGVDVLYRDAAGHDRMASADYCVAALPPHILARIPNNLGSDVHAALATPIPTPVGKIGLEYQRRWWEEDDRIYGGITETNMDLSHIWYPSYGFHGERGIVIGYYNRGQHARHYGALAPAERVRRAVAQGVKIHGEKYRTELDSAFSVAWHRTPFIEGGWISWPKRPSAPYQRLLEPAGRVYFAGDWLSYLTAWQAGAFDSARAVVAALHQRVLSS